MTDNNYPITPPPELVERWAIKSPIQHSDETWAYELFIAHQAAHWGADQELMACINYFHEYDPSWGEDSELITGLRAARRPKPLSLKEQALQALANADGADHPVVATVLTADQHALIRKALEQLDG
jgi:hypothetical protein